MNPSLLRQPKKGSIAFISQSGAIEIIVSNLMAREGLGRSKSISYDHRESKDEVELLRDLARDPETKVIMLFIEAIKQGRRFMRAAKNISSIKPIIALRAGKSQAGARAVLSHTGSLAGSDEIYTAAFKQSGILRARTIEEMLDSARALALQPTARGRRVAIITNGGGAGIIAADACISIGLEVPELPQVVQDRLKKELLPYSGTTNPIDITGAANVDNYVVVLDSLLKNEYIDVVILIVYPIPTLDIEKFVGVVLKLWRDNPKPMMISAIGSDEFMEHLRKLEKNGIPLYLQPERAAAGAAALVNYGWYRKKLGN